jgi:hypothetical protein
MGMANRWAGGLFNVTRTAMGMSNKWACGLFNVTRTAMGMQAGAGSMAVSLGAGGVQGQWDSVGQVWAVVTRLGR